MEQQRAGPGRDPLNDPTIGNVARGAILVRADTLNRRLERECDFEMTQTKTKYGIRVTLPDGDTMRSQHLLGSDWEGYRWFDSEADRDRAFDEMLSHPLYYRKGDIATQVLTKVER